MMTGKQLAGTYYFLYFGAVGGLLPYLNLFYERKGMDTTQIGILAAMMTAATLFASPMWGAVADIFHLHHRLLPGLMLLTLPMAALLAGAQEFIPLFFAISLFAISIAPVIPLGDNAVLELLGDRRYEYGKLRLWGAVGWGIGALGAGRILETTGGNFSFFWFIGLMFIGVFVAANLPAPRSFSREPYWVNAHKFLSEKRWLGFLLSVFLFGVSMSVLNNYFVLYITDIGGGEGLFGLSVAAASISEIPIFMLSPLILRRRSPRSLMIIAFVAMGVRCFFYSGIVNPWWAIAGQLLHGPSFSALWAAAVNHTNTLAPVGLGASAQALLGATTFGVSGAVGALIGSQLYDTIGPQALFQVAGVISLAGLVVFVVTEIYAARNQRALMTNQ